jgi:carbamoyl-phosphate synthase large subunit
MAKVSSLAHRRLNVLFTCIGRRVSLLESFRKAAKSLKTEAAFLGTDTTFLSPALQLCDKSFLVRPANDPRYIRQLFEIVKANKVDLIVPTVDLDLEVLAENKATFDKLGCMVLVSEPKVVQICQDKRKTFKFLSSRGFDTPVTVSPRQALADKNLKYPCFLKPWDGYASRGNAVVKNRRELEFFSKRIPHCIVQEYVAGTEYTCDVFVDFDMKVRCVVPRMRIETRSGEVSKGQIVKNLRLMNSAAKVVELFKAGPGVITIQCFITSEGVIKFIEINPRFGGGAPLAIEAGANFPKWILQQCIGQTPIIDFVGFSDKLIMLRYDSEVWLEAMEQKRDFK